MHIEAHPSPTKGLLLTMLDLSMHAQWLPQTNQFGLQTGVHIFHFNFLFFLLNC